MTAEEYRLVEAIAGIQAERAEKRIIPEAADLLEVCSRIKGLSLAKSLNIARRLEKNGLIRLRPGISREYAELKS